MKQISLFVTLVLLCNWAGAQVFSNKEVGKKKQTLVDSLKTTDYPYSLPIWGDKATKAGYTLPYSAGLSVQYFWQESSVIIDNLNIGFNNGTMYNLDGLVRFEEAKSTASSVTFRPDLWLFPFLNVYGILGKAQATTAVNFGVWVPEDNTGVETEILKASTTVDFNTTAFGLGMTPTIGVGGGFLALDLNVAWVDVPQLNKPARTFVFGPRFGKSFNLKKPGQTVAVWAGGFRVSIASETNGSLALAEVFPGGGAEINAKIDQGINRVAGAQQQVDTWWSGLSSIEQQNPVNRAKYEAANQALGRAGEVLAAADAAVNTLTTSTVQYSMDKSVKDAWNFVVGGQFQINKHIQLRAEAGFLGSRTQFTTGVQYRFGL